MLEYEIESKYQMCYLENNWNNWMFVADVKKYDGKCISLSICFLLIDIKLK